MLSFLKRKKSPTALSIEDLLNLNLDKVETVRDNNIFDIVTPAVLSSKKTGGNEIEVIEVPSSFANTKIIQKNKVNITEVYHLQAGTLESIRNIKAEVLKENCKFREYYVEEMVETEYGPDTYWEKGSSELIGEPEKTHISFSFQKGERYMPIPVNSSLHKLLEKKIIIAVGC